LAETLSLAKCTGYDGIEPRVARNHAHGIELEASARQRGEIRRQAEDSGVSICCLALSTKFSLPEDADDAVEECLEYVKLAHEIGCSRLRVFGGVFPAETSREQAIDTMASSLSRVAGLAQSAQVHICVETHDAWTHPDHVAAVMRQVNHPSIAVNWDIMHPFRTSRVPMREAFETLRPWIRHVHTHDGTLADPLVLKPAGEGEIDVATALHCLKEMEYTGFVSGEWIDCEMDLAEEIRRHRKLLYGAPVS
jgi:sugar phosphate isomerase/epimerase